MGGWIICRFFKANNFSIFAEEFLFESSIYIHHWVYLLPVLFSAERHSFVLKRAASGVRTKLIHPDFLWQRLSLLTYALCPSTFHRSVDVSHNVDVSVDVIMAILSNQTGQLWHRMTYLAVSHYSIICQSWPVWLTNWQRPTTTTTNWQW